MPDYREPLTEEEKAMEKHGFNMRDDNFDPPEKVFAKCEGCGKPYLIDKFDEGYCPDCINDEGRGTINRGFKE